MLRVWFSDGDKEVTKEMSRDEVELLVTHKPLLDFDGDGWKIIDFRYDLDTDAFKIWIEKE